MPTERQLSYSQVSAQREVDQAIYLKTYDVITSLDREEHPRWWDKALEGMKRPESAESTLRVGRPRPSWLWLAIIAVITAGVTFALIHFAWLSFGAQSGERPRHTATYSTSPLVPPPAKS